MKSDRVGIIGGIGEQHTMHMKSVLERLGTEAVVIDTLNFPDKVTFTLKDDTPIFNGMDLEGVKAFYNRTVFYSEPPYDLEEKMDPSQFAALGGWYSVYAAERERQALLGSWMRALAFRADRIANPVECFYLHYLKPHQLVLLRRAGIPIPATLVTNDAKELAAFRELHKDVVYKPVAGGASCKLVSDEDMTPDRLKLLSAAPVIFQKLHAGDDIRIFVLNGKILCALAIETDEIDYRGNEGGMHVIDLPGHVADMCLRAAETCNMVFTGIDVKRSGDEYTLLECNPSPMFMGFQTSSGYPIDEALARYLIEG